MGTDNKFGVTKPVGCCGLAQCKYFFGDSSLGEQTDAQTVAE